MRKILRTLFVLTLLFLSFQSKAQITIGTVDAGPYTPGSSIAATFTTGTTTCIQQNNVFNLFLVSPAGVETNIGSYTGFYATFVNGIIPAGTAPGPGYKLRIKSTSPAGISNDSGSFTIQAGTEAIAKVSAPAINTANPETFGYCAFRSNPSFFITNQSTSTGAVTATISNELDPNAAVTSINFDTNIKSFNPLAAHYTMLVKVVMPSGNIATKAYFIVNNQVNTAFSTTGSGLVCLPLGELVYGVDYEGQSGIQKNFPGNLYRITWGDNTENLYTLCELQKLGNGQVKHNYTRSSCGSSFDGKNNVFGIRIATQSPFCGEIGQPLSTSAKVVTVTENNFSGPSAACINTNVTFINTSIPGQNQDDSSVDCTDNNVRYNWYVDGQIVLSDVPKSTNFVHTFPAAKTYVIRLESVSGGICQGQPIEKIICIQNPPRPIFDFAGAPQTGCAPFVIQATDRSVIDANCNAENTYNWVVSPSAGVTFVATDKNPIFTFNSPGTYTVILQIRTASCGLVSSGIPQTIILVDGRPTAVLSRDITLCGLGTFDFSNTTTGPTRTLFTGTQQTIPNYTYTWSVTEADGTALPAGQYSFEGGTDLHTQYPKIKFNEFKQYKVKVVHVNSCGTTEDEQIITFSPSPVPSITVNPEPICYNDVANLSGAISNTNYVSYAWSTPAGGGTFTFPNGDNLKPVYTPSTADRTRHLATVILTVNTGLDGDCRIVSVSKDIVINPDNRGNNPTSELSKSICTGDFAVLTPTSTVAGSTFSWTAVNADGYATGFSPIGSGNIREEITNTNATQNAVVVYTITPLANGCPGVPFTFTVTVTPRPIITASLTEKTICSGSAVGITIASNIPTTFSWTSVATPDVTGSRPAPTQTTPGTSIIINDVLLNSGTIQGSVIYTITPLSPTGCAGAPITVTVKVDPTVTQSNAGSDVDICELNSYQLNGNIPAVGTGRWTIEPAQATVTFANDTDPKTVVSGLTPGQTYTFRWTISAPGACAESSDLVVVRVNTPTDPGTAATANPTTVCSAQNTGTITLTGNVGDVIRWESSIDNGATWTPIVNTTTTLTYNNITSNTQYRAVVKNGDCNIRESNAILITVTPATTIASAGDPQRLCAQRDVALQGNAFATGETGLWELVSGPGNIVIASPNAAETNVTGLVDGADYVFRWTITGNSPCGPTTSTVNIRNNAPILQSIIGNGNVVCFGQTVTLDGSTPTGGEEGVYSYTWESKTGAGAWTLVSGATAEDLTITLTTAGTISYRRTVTSGGCNSISNEYLITVQEPITNNTINANQDICSGDPIAVLTGSTPAGSNGIFRYQWQSRLATETAWTNIAGALSQNYSPSTLPASTILFRRIVTTDQCDGALQSISNEVTITVRQNAIAEFTFTAEKGCAPFALNITATNDPARNATYTWFADNVQIGTGVTFPGYTITESNKSVEIKLVVTSAQNCRSAEFKYNFSTNQAVPATFTQDKTEGCGPLSVTFVNTSVLSAGATFTWDFGNGKTSTQTNPAPVTFDPEPTGRDTTYIVTLTSFTSCGSNSVTSTVFVKAKPVAVFSPSKTDGCSPMLVNFTNTSPGSTNRYFYDFGDGTPILEKTDKSPVSHTYNTTTTQTFRATLTVVNECGTDVRGYNIRVAPQNITPELVVDANEKEGCAPLLVNFDNNSIGATRFTFDFGDGGTANTVSPGTVQHTFTRPGTYTVTMTAYNSCSEIATTETITVLPQPAADFNADITLGCAGLAVQFRNTTQDGFSYRWDFGDGTTSDEFEPIHTYDGEQEYYTVTLTATNTLGCSISVIKNQYIHIVLPPVARFNVNPSTVISIPNYTFRFEDESTNTPTIWAWDFGDGTTSSLQNPSHTYADTGSYVVRLRVSNQQGCSTSTFKTVQIVGVPGYLFVPNSFMPGGENPELREFKAKGSGIKTWKMSVFNKWGQTLWETTELNEGRPAKGWDGTFQGTVQPQGVFFWKIDIEFINGTEWKGMTYDSSAPKKTGVIHLIR